MHKKNLSVLLGVFISLLFFTYALAQKELEVMKRYDYSSPKASFESLKKAIKEKDTEGVLIYQWQLFERTGFLSDYGMSFEDFVTHTTERISKEGVSILDSFNPSSSLKITELDFVKEGKREYRENPDSAIGATTCEIILERKSDGTQVRGEAINFDRTNEWWFIGFSTR
jgi:hypothetical protein